MAAAVAARLGGAQRDGDLVAGAVAGAAALAFALLSDLASGRALEARQVERTVGAPIAPRVPGL
ncbi:MAG: hypothetical protein R2708_25260 [Vicinamibacterales bacterium]